MMKYILLIYISGINTVNKENRYIHMKDCNVIINIYDKESLVLNNGGLCCFHVFVNFNTKQIYAFEYVNIHCFFS